MGPAISCDRGPLRPAYAAEAWWVIRAEGGFLAFAFFVRFVEARRLAQVARRQQKSKRKKGVKRYPSGGQVVPRTSFARNVLRATSGQGKPASRLIRQSGHRPGRQASRAIPSAGAVVAGRRSTTRNDRCAPTTTATQPSPHIPLYRQQMRRADKAAMRTRGWRREFCTSHRIAVTEAAESWMCRRHALKNPAISCWWGSISARGPGYNQSTA